MILVSDEGELEGSGSKIIRAFSQVVTTPYYQAQRLSMTGNNFIFLIRQKKRF